MAIMPFKVINFGTIGKTIRKFLYVNHSNLQPILHSFRQMIGSILTIDRGCLSLTHSW